MPEPELAAQPLADLEEQLALVRTSLHQLSDILNSQSGIPSDPSRKLEHVQELVGNKLLPHGTSRERLAQRALRRYLATKSDSHSSGSNVSTEEILADIKALVADWAAPTVVRLRGEVEQLYSQLESLRAKAAESERSWSDAQLLVDGAEMFVNFRPKTAESFGASKPVALAIPFYRTRDPRYRGNEFAEAALRKPLFKGHRQPLVPLEPLDPSLALPDVIEEHASLAKAHGISAFAVDFYWSPRVNFSNQTLQLFQESPSLAIRYCLNWRMPTAGDLSEQYSELFFSTFRRHLDSRNYLLVGGRPLLIVETDLAPIEYARFLASLREHFVKESLAAPYVVYAAASDPDESYREYGFDAMTRLRLHNDLTTHQPTNMYRERPALLKDFKNDPNVEVYSYSGIVGHLQQSLKNSTSEYQTVYTSYDMLEGSNRVIYAFPKPGAFQAWLQRAFSSCFLDKSPEHPIVFIKSWNDWLAGAHLLPDVGSGYGNLTVVKESLERATEIRALASEGNLNRAYQQHEQGLKWQEDTLADYLRKHPGKCPIILYQIGKVGSSTVIKSLRAVVPEDPIIGLHNLVHLKEGIAHAITHLPDPSEALGVLEQGIAVKNWMDSVESDVQFRVITMVKDPIARNISHFFHAVGSFWPMFRYRLEVGDISMEEVRDTFLGLFLHFKFDTWFATHFEPVIPLKVETIRYEHGKGYAIAESDDRRFKVMVMRSEDISRVLTEACKEFIGMDIPQLSRTNTADEKFYNQLYRDFKKLPLPAWYVDEMLDDDVIRNFYSKQELDELRLKYIAGG